MVRILIKLWTCATIFNVPDWQGQKCWYNIWCVCTSTFILYLCQRRCHNSYRYVQFQGCIGSLAAWSMLFPSNHTMYRRSWISLTIVSAQAELFWFSGRGTLFSRPGWKDFCTERTVILRESTPFSGAIRCDPFLLSDYNLNIAFRERGQAYV